ncbi:MAG: glycosyltransferase 87 family protein [Acidobacteriota bacterium]
MAARKSRAILLLAALAFFSLLFVLKVKENMADFEVNYGAAKRLRGGETLYRVEDGHYQFKYFPFSAFLYLPLTLLSLSGAKVVWFGLVILSSILIFVLSARLLALPGESLIMPAVVSVLVLARYFFREIELGQINAPITLLILVQVSRLVRPGGAAAEAAAGGLAGLATALKPYAVIFFPYLAIQKKWRALASGVVVFCLALVAPVLFYGWGGNLTVLREWKSSLAASTPALLSSQDNVSLMGFLTKWTGRQRLSLALYALILVALALLIIFLIRLGKSLPRPILLDGFLLLALIPLASPLGWDYTLLAAAPAVMLICSHFPKFPRPWKMALVLNFLVIALSLYDLMGRTLYAAFMSWSVITLDFLVLIGSLVYLRVKGHA